MRARSAGLRRGGGCSRMWCGGGRSSARRGCSPCLGFWFGGLCGPVPCE
jgi:hypothetical protein